MRCNKTICAVLCAAAASATSAAPVKCPASVADAGSQHVLVNASLYDGPPEQMADLVPVPAGSVDRWRLDGIDPYLVCKYEGMAKIVTLHVQAAKVCEAGRRPFQAYCK